MLSSCRNKDYDTELKMLYSKAIDLQLDKYVYLSKNADSTSNKNADYLLLHYIDSSACNMCALNATKTWYDKLKKEPYYTKITPIILFSPLKNNRGEYFNQLYYTSDLNADIYVDTCKMFLSRNDHIPQKHIFYILLLDKQYNVQIIGDPIRNSKINELITDLICKKE